MPFLRSEACDKAGKTALFIAAKKGQQKLFEGLTSKGVSFAGADTSGETPLMKAIKFNQIKLALTMLASPFCSQEVLTQRQKNSQFENALSHAVQQGALELVELILNHPNASSMMLSQCGENFGSVPEIQQSN